MPKLSGKTKAIPTSSAARGHRHHGGGQGHAPQVQHPKVLHEIGGKPILAHVIATAAEVVPLPTFS